MERILQYHIEQEEPQMVWQFLRKKGYSRHLLTTIKETEGGLMLGKHPARNSTALHPGDTLRVRILEEASSPHIVPRPLPFPVVYEDADLLVIDKPYNMPVHPSAGNRENTLANAAARYFSDRNIPYIYRCINRLDRDTTGLLILAKHGLSAAVLSADMAARRISRTYHALVCGITDESGTISAPIGRKDGSIIERCVDEACGEPAVTHYRRISTGYLPHAHLSYSRIACTLETGRTHQIRVHLASLGHPLLGDTLYDPANPSGLSRQALHAYALRFTHPVTGEPLSFTVPEAFF